MKSAKIADLRNNLSRYLEHVRAGGSVTVLDRDRPVAWIVPVHSREGTRDGDDTRLARLERSGVIRRGAGGPPEWLGRRRPLRLRKSLLRDLLAERRSGW